MSDKFSPRQSPELKRQRFRWLEQQILPNKKLPHSAFKVAYRISEGFNDQQSDGRCWEGCRSIGDAVGLSEPSVVRLVHLLHAEGDLRVEWGQKGSGHTNSYWMIIKPPAVEVSDGIKPPPVEVSDGIKPPPVEVSGKIKPPSLNRKTSIPAEKTSIPGEKTSAGGYESQYKPQYEPKQGEPHSACASPAVEEEQGTAMEVVPAQDVAFEVAFEKFWSIYPKKVGKLEAKKAFKQALQVTTAEVIIVAACNHRDDPTRIRQGLRFTKDPKNWLSEQRWADNLSGDTIIDEHGNEVQTQPQEDVPEFLREVAAMYPNGRWS